MSDNAKAPDTRGGIRSRDWIIALRDGGLRMREDVLYLVLLIMLAMTVVFIAAMVASAGT